MSQIRFKFGLSPMLINYSAATVCWRNMFLPLPLANNGESAQRLLISNTQ